MTISNRICTFCGKEMSEDWIAEICPKCCHEERPEGYWDEEPFRDLFDKIKDSAEKIEANSKNCFNIIPFPYCRDKILKILKSENYKFKEVTLDVDELISTLEDELEFFEDEVGGLHGCGVGYRPDGNFCGECVEQTCLGCVNFNNGEVK